MIAINSPAAAVVSEPRPDPLSASGEYAELKRLVQARGLLDRQYGYYIGKFAITGGLLSLALIAMIFSPTELWLRLAEAAFLGFVVVQIGLLAHDLSHQQIVGSGGALISRYGK